MTSKKTKPINGSKKPQLKGINYSKGESTEVDFVKAVHYYKLAAAQNLSGGLNNLGFEDAAEDLARLYEKGGYG